MLTRVLALLVPAAGLLVACASTPPKTCTPEAREALLTLYGQMGGEIINSGACDKYDRVEQCPAYIALEAHFIAARKGICP